MLPAPLMLPAEIHTEYLARTAVDGNQPEQRANHGCFARAIGPKQADGTGGNRNRKVIECPDAAVGLRDTGKFEQH